MFAGMGAVTNRLRWVVIGEHEPRLRATWRFLLAWPLLPLVGALMSLVMPLLGSPGMIAGGPLQVVFLLILLLPWARYVDRRPLSDYGVSASESWVLDLLIGLVATGIVWTGWYALASSLGWVQIGISMTAPQDSLTFGLAATLVSLLLNSGVQDVVFFAIVLAGAAEGLRSRDIEPGLAVLGGWIVGTLFFTAIHGTPTMLDLVGTALSGGVYGLLYVHTGELALTIGVHAGGSFVVSSLFTPQARAEAFPSIFELTKAFPEVGVVIGRAGPVLVTYLVLVGWLWLYRGDVGIETEIAEWTGPADAN